MVVYFNFELISGVKTDTKDTEQIITIIIDIFYHVPAARPRFIEILCLLIFQSEKTLKLGRCSPYHEPLIRFLLKYPLETIVLVLQEKYMKVCFFVFFSLLMVIFLLFKFFKC